MIIPQKVQNRIITGLKKFQTIISNAKMRDINESDTALLITDILSEIFGYDKYNEITSEYSIRNTFCDLAVKLNEKLVLLIEVKAIGLDLKDNHVKQAIDYAANQGTDWVILTNALVWRVYKITFAKPIDFEMLFEIDFSTINHKSNDQMERLYILTREGMVKSAIDEFHSQKQVTNKYTLGAILQTDVVLAILRREIKRLSPDVKADVEDIKKILIEEIIKRDVMEGEKALDAKKKINKSAKKLLRSRKEKPTGDIISNDEQGNNLKEDEN